jgi:hypothetical protein
MWFVHPLTKEYSLSRKDHRDYDAALQKLRSMEAVIKKPEGFQPKDIIAICLVAFMALIEITACSTTMLAATLISMNHIS